MIMKVDEKCLYKINFFKDSYASRCMEMDMKMFQFLSLNPDCCSSYKCRQRPSPALVTCCGATSQAVSYLQMLGRIHIARLPCGGSGNIVHQQILC